MALFLLAVLVIIAAVIVVWLVGLGDGATSWSSGRLPYHLVESPLTPVELAFYGVLRGVAEAEGLVVLAKVRLADIVFVPRGTAQRRGHLSRVAQKHLDFVLCDRGGLRPVAAVELDDSSHARPDRQQRDAFVEDVCRSASLALIRVPVRRAYDTSELVGCVRRCLTLSKSSAPRADEPVLGSTCPRCGGRLVQRTRRFGGSAFLGCRNYPDCRYTRGLVPAN